MRWPTADSVTAATVVHGVEACLSNASVQAVTEFELVLHYFVHEKFVKAHRGFT